MSKSLGNVIEPFQVVDVYGADALRFYALREVRFGQDGEVSPEGFEQRYTSELANEYGNLASRTLAMIVRYRDGVVPEAEPAPELAAEFDGICEAVAAHLDRADLTPALDEIWQRVKRLNRYVQETQPWQLAKDEEQAAQLDRVLYGLAEGLRVVSVLVHAFMPASAERLLAALGREDRSFENARFGAAPGGATARRARPAVPARRGARALSGLRTRGSWSTPTATSTAASPPRTSCSTAPGRPVSRAWRPSAWMRSRSSTPSAPRRGTTTSQRSSVATRTGRRASAPRTSS